jgi:hypothetical protein
MAGDFFLIGLRMVADGPGLEFQGRSSMGRVMMSAMP